MAHSISIAIAGDVAQVEWAGQTPNAADFEMTDLNDELDRLLGPILTLPPMSDAEVVQFILELKAMPDPSPIRLTWIEELEAAWRRAAHADMRPR